MPDTTSISAGKELLELAIEFQNLVTSLNTLSNKFNVYKKMMESHDFYNGRNRDNLDSGNFAVAQHLSNLAEFYGLCYAYICYAFNSMAELDKELAKAIVTAYGEELYDQ